MCILISKSLYFLLVADAVKVGCVTEFHRCLRRFAIYVGHMLPRLLQIAVQYWTSQQWMATAALLSCPQTFHKGHVQLVLLFYKGFCICAISRQVYHLQLGWRRWWSLLVHCMCFFFFKSGAWELLLWHERSLCISKGSWLTFYIISKLLPNSHTDFQYHEWSVLEHLKKDKKQFITLADSLNIVGRLNKSSKAVFVFLFLLKEYCEAWTSEAQGERPLLCNP